MPKYGVLNGAIIANIIIADDWESADALTEDTYIEVPDDAVIGDFWLEEERRIVKPEEYNEIMAEVWGDPVPPPVEEPTEEEVENSSETVVENSEPVV